MKRRDPIAYVVEMLQRNPLYEAEWIVDSRSAFLGLGSRRVAESPTPDHSAQRDRLQADIDAVRNQFWTLALDDLLQRITGLDGSRFPELQPALRRLRTVAGLRVEFPRLATHKRAYLPLVHALKRCAVLPPRESSQVKEQFLMTHSRSGDLPAAREAVEMMRREFPALFELEADWLKTIEQLRARSR